MTIPPNSVYLTGSGLNQPQHVTYDEALASIEQHSQKKGVHIYAIINKDSSIEVRIEKVKNGFFHYLELAFKTLWNSRGAGTTFYSTSKIKKIIRLRIESAPTVDTPFSKAIKEQERFVQKAELEKNREEVSEINEKVLTPNVLRTGTSRTTKEIKSAAPRVPRAQQSTSYDSIECDEALNTLRLSLDLTQRAFNVPHTKEEWEKIYSELEGLKRGFLALPSSYRKGKESLLNKIASLQEGAIKVIQSLTYNREACDRTFARLENSLLDMEFELINPHTNEEFARFDSNLEKLKEELQKLHFSYQKEQSEAITTLRDRIVSLQNRVRAPIYQAYDAIFNRLHSSFQTIEREVPNLHTREQLERVNSQLKQLQRELQSLPHSYQAQEKATTLLNQISIQRTQIKGQIDALYDPDAEY